VVIDVSNSPSFEDSAVMRFFETSTRNLLAAEAGVAHHVALSVVGDERLPESGYFRAKIAQEQLIEKSSIPYSIVHATQFFEFVGSIADAYSNAAPAASPNGPRRSPSASSHATSTRSPVSGAGPGITPHPVIQPPHGADTSPGHLGHDTRALDAPGYPSPPSLSQRSPRARFSERRHLQ